MNPTIVIGDGAGSYTFAVSPDFAPEVETIRDSRGAAVGERHIWRIRGYLAGAGIANVNSLWNELKTRLASEPANCYFKDGETVLQALSASDAEYGPVFENLRIESGGETCWDSELLFSFDIIAERFTVADNIIDNANTTRFEFLEDGRQRIMREGKVKTTAARSAYEAAATYAPTAGTNFRTVGWHIATDIEDREAEYRFELLSLFAPLPPGVVIAKRLVEESIESGMKTLQYVASFTGAGAAEAARQFEPQGELVSQKRITAEDENSVEVTYTVVDSADAGQLLQFEDRFEVKPGLPEQEVFLREGLAPLVFEGAPRPTVVVETGYAVCKEIVPAAQPPLTSDNLKLTSQKTTLKRLYAGAEGKPQIYQRHWEYEYISTTVEPLTEEQLLPELQERLDAYMG